MPRIIGALIYAGIMGSVHLVAFCLLLAWAVERLRWGWPDIGLYFFALGTGAYLGARAMCYVWVDEHLAEAEQQLLHRQVATPPCADEKS